MSYERSDQNARERRRARLREAGNVQTPLPSPCAACACAGRAGWCEHGKRNPTGLYREVEVRPRVFGFWQRVWRHLRWALRSRKQWATLGKLGANLGIKVEVGETQAEFRERVRAAASRRGLQGTVAALGDRLSDYPNEDSESLGISASEGRS